MRRVLIGLIIGAASGIVQFLMLSKFTSSVTKGAFSKKTVLFAIFQFFLPLIVLLACALLFRSGLLWTAVGMIFSLVTCAFVRFILTRKSEGD